MAKKKETPPQEEETIELLPKDTNIQSEVKLNVTKAEMSNILTIQIQEKLEKEIQDIYRKISALTAEKNSLIYKIKSEAIKDMTKVLPLGTKLEDYSVVCSDFIKDQDQIGSIKRSVDFATVTILLTYNKSTHAYGYKAPFINVDSETKISYAEVNIRRDVDDKQLFKISKEIENLQEEINEVRNRLAKARDSKYVTAQLNLGILANTRNGTQVVENIQKMVEHLSSTVFSKKEPLKLPE